MNFGSNTNIGSAKFIPYLYDRIKSIIESFSNNSVISSDKDNVLIPTDASGNNAVYTNSTVNFLVFYGGINQTSSWTISVLTQSNVTTSQVGNAISITNIAADEGYYVVRAIRTDYTTITKKITVYKSKRGATGETGSQGIQGVPGGDIIDQYDNETIVLDGASKLKVNPIDYTNVTNEVTNGWTINSSFSSPSYSNRIVSIGTNKTDITQLWSATDSISVGWNNMIHMGSGSVVNLLNKCITIGDTLRIRTGSSTPITNAIAIGSNHNGISDFASNTVAIGKDPSNSIPDSVAITFDGTVGITNVGINSITFKQISNVRSGDGTLLLTIPTYTIPGAAINTVSLDLDLFGLVDPEDTSYGFYKAKKSLTYINGTKVIDSDIAAEAYSTSPLTGCSFVAGSTFSGGGIPITITVAGSGGELNTWIAFCTMKLLA
jgi:hypothetical protein